TCSTNAGPSGGFAVLWNSSEYVAAAPRAKNRAPVKTKRAIRVIEWAYLDRSSQPEVSDCFSHNVTRCMLLNAPSTLLPVAGPTRGVITGSFRFTGAEVASELSRRGWTVCSLTNRRRPTGADHIASVPLRFESKHLETALSGADAFVNTYWLRFPYGGQTF